MAATSNKFEVEIKEVRLHHINIDELEKKHRLTIKDKTSYTYFEDADGKLYRRNINSRIVFSMTGKKVLKPSYPIFTLEYFSLIGSPWAIKEAGVIETIVFEDAAEFPDTPEMCVESNQ